MLIRIFTIFALVIQPMLGLVVAGMQPCPESVESVVVVDDSMEGGCCCCENPAVKMDTCGCEIEEAPQSPTSPTKLPSSISKTSTVLAVASPVTALILDTPSYLPMTGQIEGVIQPTNHNQKQALLGVWRT